MVLEGFILQISAVNIGCKYRLKKSANEKLFLSMNEISADISRYRVDRQTKIGKISARIRTGPFTSLCGSCESLLNWDITDSYSLIFVASLRE